MLRTSSYTIYVDLPEEMDEVLLLQGYTGAYDRVSRPVARYLRSLSGRRAPDAENGEEWRPRDETLAALERRGYLTAKTHEEEEAVLGRIAGALYERDRRYQPGYVFMPTYDCNLRCPYCFQSHMRSDPALGHLIRTMSPEVVDRIFAAIPAIEERHGLDPNGTRDRGFLFFGGEPLLAASRPIVEYILQKARALDRPKFSAISNATQLEAYRDLLGPGKIESIQITLDGPPREHDRKRIDVHGAGSFEKIAGNITMALDLGTRISVRTNIDRANIDFLPQLDEEIAARGWKSYSNFTPYVSPIHAAGGGMELMDSWVLKKQLGELQREHPEMRRIGHLDDSLRGRLRKVFEERKNPTSGFKASFCGAHSTMYIFDAFADVYACWEQTGDRNLRIGSVAEGGELRFEDERNEAWRSRTILKNPVCRRCRYAFYCGGGCANLAQGRTGDLNTSFCDGFANRFRATAAKVYLDFLAGRKSEAIPEPACDR
ncbi:MAG: radical SAM protein [Thermoanaerobaculia bacterium]